MKIELYDPKERAKEKQASRDKDAEDLRSGKKTREDLRKENGMFHGMKLELDLNSCKNLSCYEGVPMLQEKYEKMSTEELLDLISKNEIESYDLTFVAEHLGDKCQQIIKCLLNLLESKHSLVREGAVIGLAKNMYNYEILLSLQEVLVNESNNGVKKEIKETLNAYYEDEQNRLHYG
jgi:hypothetical protein